jgi:hypothetical protein
LEDAAGNVFLSGASQIVLRDALGDATGDALNLSTLMHCLLKIREREHGAL